MTIALGPLHPRHGTHDPTNGSPETWTNLESHHYKYDISITNTAAAQGLTGSMAITWDARNQ